MKHYTATIWDKDNKDRAVDIAVKDSEFALWNALEEAKKYRQPGDLHMQLMSWKDIVEKGGK